MQSFASAHAQPPCCAHHDAGARQRARLAGIGPVMPRIEPPLWISVVGAIGLGAAALLWILLG